MLFSRFKSLAILALVFSVGAAAAFAGTLPPRLLKPVDPVHPELLAADGIDGAATLSMKINNDGTVSNIKVVNATRSEFGKAAKEAAEQWEFKPASKDGQPVSVRVIQEFKFAAPIDRKLARIAGREVFVQPPETVVAWEALEEKPKLVRSPKHTPYPEDFAGSGISGDVEINFIINTDGDVINPEIVNTTESELNDEALEALLDYHWRATRQNREYVNVGHSIIIKVEE